jgi:hypothetical protein
MLWQIVLIIKTIYKNVVDRVVSICQPISQSDVSLLAETVNQVVGWTVSFLSLIIQ